MQARDKAEKAAVQTTAGASNEPAKTLCSHPIALLNAEPVTPQSMGACSTSKSPQHFQSPLADTPAGIDKGTCPPASAQPLQHGSTATQDSTIGPEQASPAAVLHSSAQVQGYQQPDPQDSDVGSAAANVIGRRNSMAQDVLPGSAYQMHLNAEQSGATAVPSLSFAGQAVSAPHQQGVLERSQSARSFVSE